MARLPYIDPDAVSDTTAQQAFRDIKQVRGRVVNLFRVIGNCPAALSPVFGLSRFVRDESTLSPRIRELAILATALKLDVMYEIVHHIDSATKAGIADSEIGALRRGSYAGFDAQEQAVIRYAVAVSTTREISDSAFRDLTVRFSPSELVELTVTVAWYHFVAAVLQPLQVELEK